MTCKFALVVFCLFVVGYVDAASDDLWKLLSASDKFQLISRTYSLGASECAYMKVESRDQSTHTLNTLMGFRDGTTKQYSQPGSFTITVNGDQVTVRRASGSTGVSYNLVYSDGQGCNILKGEKGGQRGDECELWAPLGQEAHAQGSTCTAKFGEHCAAAVQHPYKADCQIPEPK
uniref:Salivary secreted lipocalin n=1 Tax=Ornithodoros parkeri TaxID=140564 RepID=A6N9X2_ORNPR|nr:salivary secreted lipocalin [Ornithodoros parkeri]